MFKKILVAIDGSKNSYEALKAAIELAQKFVSKIYLVSVVNTANLPTNVGVSYAPNLTHELENVAKTDLEKAEEMVKSSKLDYEVKILSGDPRDELIEFPKEHQVDLIVLGKTGNSALERVFVGSVTRYVSEHADKSLLIVS